jgi:hypothetical protein
VVVDGAEESQSRINKRVTSVANSTTASLISPNCKNCNCKRSELQLYCENCKTGSITGSTTGSF